MMAHLAQLGLLVAVPCTQGAGLLPLTMLPCAQNLPQCASSCGVDEFQALHEWLATSPTRAETIGQAHAESALEKQAFELIKDLGLSLLATSLDYVALCQHSEPRCGMLAREFEVVQALRARLDARLREMAKDYLPDTGLRSPILRVGHSVRSDLDSFLRDLPTLQMGLPAAEASARLAQTTGLKARMLAWHLGMHFWVRNLELPGRGAPVLILLDEYTSFEDMVLGVVGMMVRHGQPQLAMAEVGVRFEEWWAPSLLRSSAGLQYVGIVLPPDASLDSGASAQQNAFEQMRGEVQQSDLANRVALHYATSQDAANAFPDRSLDAAFLDLRGLDAAAAQQQMALWESKVKPAGVLAGRGFEPGSLEIVKAVCAQRFSTDLHLGVGGGFWWLVEPPEEE
ncbi:unnamed protein product [Durusdinium trenchii]|uniref:Uncharacterized protein n=1 Tax=Durusdinium trenchii TaxID=1381693 RepID=A0ABP0J4M3_9DINO